MRRSLLAVALILCLAVIARSQEEARFMSYPDISGDRVLFTYDGDLWVASLKGGLPYRLTTHPSGEVMGKFSPDGRWIAFTASYHGTPDVYVMPSEGGTPRRLSFFPAPALMVTWTPDSKHIVFRSPHGRIPVSRDMKLYRVSVDGGMPEPLPVDRGASCSFAEDGRRMLYTRKGNEEYYWKRYKGGQYPDIWMADLQTRQYSPVTDYVGRNTYPMWIGNSLYFASDRGPGGITNLYAQDLKTKAVRQITGFTDFDVMWPSTDRRNIVFVQNGYLHVLDPRSDAPRKVAVRAPCDNWRLQDRWVNAAEYIHFMDVSNDGTRVALTARGDVFLARLGEKDTSIRNLTLSGGARESFARISPDGKSVVYFSDRSGEYQLYQQEAGGGGARQLTDSLNRTVYHPRWSPDGTKVLFGDKDFAIHVLDLATRKLTRVDESRYLDNDEFTWEISDYSWSPDSRWIAYSFTRENRNNAIFLYDTAEGKKHQLTDDFFDNLNPVWDANGGTLYFLSNRNYQIGMDLFEDNHIAVNPTRVMAVQLRKGEKPLFARPAHEAEEPPAPGPGTDDPAVRFRVDTEGIQDRVSQLPVEPGNYFHLVAGKGYCAWSSVRQFTEDEYEDFYKPRGQTKWTFHIFSLKDEKTVEFEDKIAAAQPSVNGEQLIIKRENKVFVTSFDKAFQSRKPGREVDLSGLNYRVSVSEEWNQIFSDTWRWYRDFFYDRDMHGRDWKDIGEKYRPYLKHIRTRQQLNWVLSEMVGELCVSHTYISGGDMGAPSAAPPLVYTGQLGADLAPDPGSGRYRFQRIYGPTRYFTGLETPLSRPDVEVKEGDYLLAVNGKAVRALENYFEQLQISKDDYVTISVSSEPSGAGARS